MSDHTITISRDGDGPIRFEPEAIQIAIPVAAGHHFRIVVSDGWRATVDPPGNWRVTPDEPNLDAAASYSIVSVPDGAVVEEGRLQVNLDLRSSFDPARCALPLRNRASELGEISPRPDIFERTVTMMSERMKRVLFRGLYSDIVFLHAEGKHRGGMCSGMARWAIARGLGQEPDPPTTEAAIERIQLYHGRQLRDRALLSALPWFLRGSPKAAYQAVRTDLLRDGITDRALDVAVPKLWRLDLAQALVAEGHTVVPYRLRQNGADRATLEVYDPNHPSAVGSDEPQTIHFDLARNRYAYRKLVSMEQSNVGIIAVRQTAYAKPGTAFLATLGSIVFAPRRAWKALVGAYDAART
jgi:hypothetical protein